jgi:hypothetical protein
MDENRGIAAVERAATGLHRALVADFASARPEEIDS